MQVITLDFETYYDQDFSLSKMTTQEYIQDKRFQIIGMAIKINDGKTRWFEGWQEGFRVLRAAAEHDECVLVAHNALFDYSILTEQLPLFQPARVVCTMSMARSLGLDGQAHGASLAKLATYLQAQGLPIPNKGDEVVRALGKRLSDFTQEELDAYGEYCKTDVDICYQAFTAMYPMLPKAELAWQDLVIRMHAEPKLRLDRDVLKADLVRVQERQAKLLDRVQDTLGVASHEEALKTLRSNDKFAEVLRGYGVTPPTKISATTGKTTYAFAKTDKEMTDLLESDNADVQDVVAARLGTKSSIEQTRIEKFIQLSYLPRLSIPLMVSGAHTHRLAGADSINLQNLPSGRVKGQSKALRQSIVALDGYTLIAADSSQIEARVLAYVANQSDLLYNFSNNIDPYVAMAARIYNQPADEILTAHKAGDKEATIKRQLGKAGILGAGYGASAPKFKDMCRASYGVVIDDEMAQLAVDTYRQANQNIVNFWRTCTKVLKALIRGESGQFGGPNGDLFKFGLRKVFNEFIPAIQLPDGMWINYRNLRVEEEEVDGEFRQVVKYDKVKGRTSVPTYTYGSAVTENLVQALAFAIMKRQALKIAKRYPVLFNVHDEFVSTAPEAEREQALAYIEECMRFVPSWVAGCPITCEAASADNYGDC